MSGRRLAALGAGVVGLLAVAGVASHGRPLSGNRGRGSGPTASFFDYVATTLMILAIVVLGIVVYAVLSEQRSWVRPQRRRTNLVSGLIGLAGAILLSTFILHTGFEKRLQRAAGNVGKAQPGARGLGAAAGKGNLRNPHIRWDEIAVAATLLGGIAVVIFARRGTKRTLRPLRSRGRGAIVSDALDDSLEDLKTDPDLRRAIIAAYARMETALARAGLPRHPSEAPFEYVERALGTLELEVGAIERLTGLFEWAKFSQHEPGAEMRDEAINALIAVRDELRRPVEEPVPA